MVLADRAFTLRDGFGLDGFALIVDVDMVDGEAWMGGETEGSTHRGPGEALVGGTRPADPAVLRGDSPRQTPRPGAPWIPFTPRSVPRDAPPVRR